MGELLDDEQYTTLIESELLEKGYRYSKDLPDFLSAHSRRKNTIEE